MAIGTTKYFQADDWNKLISVSYYFAPPKPDIINMSLGVSSLGEPMGTNLRNACNAVYQAGIILVASTGNDAIVDPVYPARCENVIAVGGHAEDQTLYEYSNGGADLIAPGRRVPSMDMTGDASWLYNGTSNSSAHVTGLAALVLQYARENNLELDPGYMFELIKHAALDMPLIPDPVFKGKGKARTLESIDLVASNWPIDYEIEFSDYAFADGNYPAFHIDSDVNQTFTLTNITDILGNTVETIENLTVIVKQVYFNEPNDPNLPGDSNEVFPAISQVYPADGNSVTLSLSYTVPPDTIPGLVQTRLALEFSFVGNSRVIRVCHHQPNLLWYAAIPGDLNLNNSVDMTDLSIFAQRWRNNSCAAPDYCQRADINRSGYVDWNDVSVLADNWLEN